MRKAFKRVIAALLAAVTLGAPATASADMGDYCSTGTLVKSNATGGDYVAGLLIYETMGTVSRTAPSSSSTTTVSGTTTVGVPGTGTGGTMGMTETTNNGSTTRTTTEPIGFYLMNDGSVYEIDCLTNVATKVG